MLTKGSIHEYCFIFPIRRIKSRIFYQAPFTFFDLRPDAASVAISHNIPLDFSGTCPLVTRDRRAGSTGGTGLCNREKDVAAKPLWKMPNPAVVGSQQIECDAPITRLLFKVSRDFFFLFS